MFGPTRLVLLRRTLLLVTAAVVVVVVVITRCAGIAWAHPASQLTIDTS